MTMTAVTTATCDQLAVATVPALATHARAIVRTGPGSHAGGCEGAIAVFQDVNAACSRFDPASELRRVNAEPDRWHSVGRTFRTALREAWWAYRRTSGEFDPRLLDRGVGRAALPWSARFADGSCSVHLGGAPVDLDGISRGLALRWAGRALQGTQHLLEIGDDCACQGRGPDGAPWRVGLRDPLDPATPLAVLALSDSACATSTSVAAQAAGHPVGAGLLAVTVVGPDPVAAEVWTTVLLAVGAEGVAEAAARRRLPAAWVTADGRLETSASLEPKVLWRR